MKSASLQNKYNCQGVIIDPDAGNVTGESETVRLGPVNMRVLQVLLINAGNVVSRADIFESVWENQIVSDDVLTRCISDLRKQLAKYFESEKIIETLPKRGYRWTLPVSVAITEEKKEGNVLQQNEIKNIDNVGPESTFKQNSSLSIELTTSKLVIYSIIGLLVLSTSSLWFVDRFYSTDYKKVALLPIETSEQSKHLSAEIEQLLSSELLENGKLRVLARSAIKNRPQNHFTYFTREFGTDWIIEGNLSEQSSGVRLTLNLVDARSATVSYSQTGVFEQTNANLNIFCERFADKLKVLSE